METLHLQQLLIAGLCTGVRIGGLMLFAPFFSSETISAPVKAGLTLVLTALLYPVFSPVQLDLGETDLVLVVGGEMLIGLALGLTMQFVLDAAQAAGQFIGTQAGFSLVTLLDPQSQADSPVLAVFAQLTVLLIFLALDVHHWILRGLAASFIYLPPGRAVLGLRSSGDLLRMAGGIWLMGLQIAAPVLALTLLVDLALGFLARVSPQFPILFIGISIKATLGIATLAISLRFWPQLFGNYFLAALNHGQRLLHWAR